jgi:hypothetical protein
MSKEFKMIYNQTDNKYYLYYGEDYLMDTNIQETAFKYFEHYTTCLCIDKVIKKLN